MKCTVSRYKYTQFCNKKISIRASNEPYVKAIKSCADPEFFLDKFEFFREGGSPLDCTCY